MDFRGFLNLIKSMDSCLFSCWHWWAWMTQAQSSGRSEGLPELIPVSLFGHKLPFDIRTNPKVPQNTGLSSRATKLSYFKEMWSPNQRKGSVRSEPTGKGGLEETWSLGNTKSSPIPPNTTFLQHPPPQKDVHSCSCARLEVTRAWSLLPHSGF